MILSHYAVRPKCGFNEYNINFKKIITRYFTLLIVHRNTMYIYNYCFNDSNVRSKKISTKTEL